MSYDSTNNAHSSVGASHSSSNSNDDIITSRRNAGESGRNRGLNSLATGLSGAFSFKPILFGRPSKCLPLGVPPSLYAEYDAALEEELELWQQRMHFGLRSNCHTFICDALNNMHRRAGGEGAPYTMIKLGLAVYTSSIEVRPRTQRNIAAAVTHDAGKALRSLVESIVGLRQELQSAARRQLNRIPSQSYVPWPVSAMAAPVLRLYYGLAASPTVRNSSNSNNVSSSGGSDLVGG